ncbi:MAG: methyltransferase domain-containing protein [Bacteroidia bacterium]|nr:methyltransferase domain-containing protein [Bacteroidia bacterium]
MQTNKKQLWFKEWFNSPYYHLLYKDRDHREAELFIDNLLALLQPASAAKMLDLACGKGRHSIYLNKKGYDVTGLDLSEESISSAAEFENDRLHFYVHDMRKIYRTNYYDCVFNLFTSFGYFSNERDNYQTINAVCKNLKAGGFFVLDFFNSNRVIECLVKQEERVIEGLRFQISKKLENGFIVKQIAFTDNGQEYFFEERVKALQLSDFEKYFASNKLKIVHLRGNYHLDQFDEKKSERLILIAQKINS